MEAEAEGLGDMIQELADLFYYDNGLVASPRTESFHREFNVLTDLFDQVSIQTNVKNTLSMAYRPYYTPGGFLESTYMRRVTEVGPSYRERLWRQVKCPE